MKSKDLKVIRQYTHKGIDVTVEIDFVNGTASFVEKDRGNTTGYSQKKWVFASRGLDYVKSWSVILEAMQKVNQQVIVELQAFEDQKTKETVELAMALQKDHPEDHA